jgi:hypothetical protein
MTVQSERKRDSGGRGALGGIMCEVDVTPPPD